MYTPYIKCLLQVHSELYITVNECSELRCSETVGSTQLKNEVVGMLPLAVSLGSRAPSDPSSKLGTARGLAAASLNTKQNTLIQQGRTKLILKILLMLWFLKASTTLIGSEVQPKSH